MSSGECCFKYLDGDQSSSGGIVSINSDSTPAQSFVGTGGALVTTTGGITTINAGSATGGIHSINGDTTTAQLITGSNGISASTSSGTTTVTSNATTATTANTIVKRDSNVNFYMKFALTKFYFIKFRVQENLMI